jgi:hypothetical protein
MGYHENIAAAWRDYLEQRTNMYNAGQITQAQLASDFHDAQRAVGDLGNWMGPIARLGAIAVLGITGGAIAAGAGGGAAAGAGAGAAGGGAAGGASGGAAAGGAAAGGSGWGTAAILGGTNLLGAAINSNTISKANQANRNAIEQHIRQALAQLDPAAIQQLTQTFLPQIMAQQSPMMQSQVQQLNQSNYARGLGTSPIAGMQEAALRAGGVNAASTQAFQQAMGLAGQRASAITGSPIYQQQPNLAYGTALSDTVNQTLLARYFQQGQRQPAGQPQQAFPFILPNAAQGYGGGQAARNYPYGSNYGSPFMTGGGVY